MNNIAESERRRKSQSTAARVGPKPKQGPPSFASAQALRVLDIQREHPEGVSREKYLTPVHLGGYGITQVGARVHELETLGYIFEHRRDPGEKFTTYILRGEPLGPLVRKPQAAASVESAGARQHEPVLAGVGVHQPEQASKFVSWETGRQGAR